MNPLFLITVFGIFVFLIAQPASAQTNSTSQGSLPKMFITTNIPTNAYADTTHNFFIVPPDGWVLKSQPNGTGNSLVEFSNENSSNLAHLDIYFDRVDPIPASIFSLSDDQILKEFTAKLFDPSKTNILQNNIQRFSDGFIVQVIFTQNQAIQNKPVIEMLIFWLADGRQYFVTLTSSQNNFIQNEAAFEKSASTFNVNPQKIPAVPEFGFLAIAVFTVITITSLVFTKMKKLG
jgi:hypothetical protein